MKRFIILAALLCFSLFVSAEAFCPGHCERQYDCNDLIECIACGIANDYHVQYGVCVDGGGGDECMQYWSAYLDATGDAMDEMEAKGYSSGRYASPDAIVECQENHAQCLAECVEPECVTDADCGPGGTCGYYSQKCEYANGGGEDCWNDYDDDGDGYIDCWDDECYDDVRCMVSACYEDSDCEYGAVCVQGDCVVEETEYSVEVTAADKTGFYMNGLNQEQVKVKVFKVSGGKKLPAAGEPVEFELYSYQDHNDIGSLNSYAASTDAFGEAETWYEIPFVDAGDLQWIGVNYLRATIDVYHDGKLAGRKEFELYPPIFIESLKLTPDEIEESHRGALYLKLSNKKDSLVAVQVSVRHDWLNTVDSLEGAVHAIDGVTEKESEKFYLYPAEGIRSIDLDDVPGYLSIAKNTAKSVGMDMLASGINNGVSVVGGKYLESFVGEASDASLWWPAGQGNWQVVKRVGAGQAEHQLKSFVAAPANFGTTPLMFKGWAEEAQAIGGSRSGAEAFWNAMVLFVDGASFTVGVLTTPKELAFQGFGAQMGRDAKLSVIFNGAKELFKATAQATRAAKTETVKYPRVAWVTVVDEDGYALQGYVGYRVLRHE